MHQRQIVSDAAADYAAILPSDHKAEILDVGFGSGWFMAACLKLGYTTLSGAEFGIARKSYVRDWHPGIRLYEIESDIGTFLSETAERYDFIHMSHVIEHIPKYSLLWVVDAVYRALKKGGTLCLRTPNMEGLTANSSFYVTLAHEYGFCGSNLRSLLDICGFDDIRFHRFGRVHTLKQYAGRVLRWPFLKYNEYLHRLFGVSQGGPFGTELVVTAVRGELPPYFHPKYK